MKCSYYCQNIDACTYHTLRSLVWYSTPSFLSISLASPSGVTRWGHSALENVFPVPPSPPNSREENEIFAPTQTENYHLLQFERHFYPKTYATRQPMEGLHSDSFICTEPPPPSTLSLPQPFSNEKVRLCQWHPPTISLIVYTNAIVWFNRPASKGVRGPDEPPPLLQDLELATLWRVWICWSLLSSKMLWQNTPPPPPITEKAAYWPVQL